MTLGRMYLDFHDSVCILNLFSFGLPGCSSLRYQDLVRFCQEVNVLEKAYSKSLCLSFMPTQTYGCGMVGSQ